MRLCAPQVQRACLSPFQRHCSSPWAPMLTMIGKIQQWLTLISTTLPIASRCYRLVIYKLPEARGNQGKTATDAAEVLISDQPSRAQKFYRRDAHCTRKWVAGSQAGKNHPRSNSHSAPFRFSLKNVPLASSEPAQPILIEVALPSM